MVPKDLAGSRIGKDMKVADAMPLSGIASVIGCCFGSDYF